LPIARSPGRRPLLVAALVLSAAAAGCGGGPAAEHRSGTRSSGPPSQTRPAAGGLSPAQQVGQALILSFEGPTVPGYVQRALREGRVAGVILFADNIVSPGQLRRLTAKLQRASGHGALIMVDQEGGPVEMVPFAAPAVGEARQETTQEAAVQASAAGRELRSLGVNVNLAPVADVPSVDGAALAGRAFAGDAGAVAARVTAAVRAYDAAGVGSTAKHFPGLGAARANTDQAPVTIPFLTSQDLAPFKAAVAAGVPLVMASHALYRNLDPNRIASQSEVILRGLLRGRLGFRGVIVTDSMEAVAVARRSSLPEAAVRSLEAGADLLLLTGDGSFRPVSRHLRALARRDPGLRSRLARANARVFALKRRLRLSPPAG
jgi:beta-N-acetylhexosaminidase